MISRALDVLTKIEKVIASLFIFVLTVFVILDVGARELFKTGIPWAQKGAVYMMIWAGFIGAILVAHKLEHLRPEVADKFWTGKLKPWYLRIQNFLVFIFCAVMAWYSVVYVIESREFADRNIIIDMPMWILQSVIPYCFFSMSLRYLYYSFSPREKDPQAVH
ncbi:MAG TPA: TRAP transporter small permease subunit [Bacteriovoracaceae bacterium]|nr:TRAP transporter small permease subunit [Bacteriovoracaceae bacterium]